MGKITKGYKAFEFDWTCRGKDYGGPGKTTTQKGELDICNNGIPAPTNTKELYLMVGSDWKKVPLYRIKEKTQAEMWADMPAETVEYIKSLPEFDAQIFKQITGIK